MVAKRIAPYGKWESPISIDDVTAGSKALSSPRSDVGTGRVFYLQALPTGANTIVEVVTREDNSHELKHVLPAPHSVSTAVYEYGGGPYDVLPSDPRASGDEAHQRIIFSDVGDGNSLKLLDVDAGVVTSLVSGAEHLRYADFGPAPYRGGSSGSRIVLAVEEDHADPLPSAVRNYVVAVNVESGRVTRVASGADFYTTPRFSPDGRWVSWRAWDHPEMPWTKSRLCVASVVASEAEQEVGKSDSISIGEVQIIAGGEGGQCVGESAWGLDGVLYYTYEEEGAGDWRQLWRFRPDVGEKEKLKLAGLEEVEMGDCSMLMDCRTFCFLSDKSMILNYTKYASYSIVHVDLESLKVTPLDVPLIDTRMDPIAAINSSSFLVLGSGVKEPHGVYHCKLDDDLKPTTSQLATTSEKRWPSDTFSKPQHIEFISKNKPHRPVHGFYWPPHNPKFTGPEDTLPPLLINPHGGPTGHAPPGLKLGGIGGGNVPFWTSRGFAYFAINYTGSSGHGRAYRQRLDGQWGILDRDDVPESIEHLCAAGLADRSRVGIHGGSAGGYNVLQSLVWHADAFAAGVCYCGVSDTRALGEGTHKLESHYLNGLLYEPGLSEEERRAVDLERSPVWHAEKIRAPLLLCHGDADTVVPIEQSFEIERRVRERGGTVEMVVARGDGHMFRKRESVRLVMEKEVAWFLKYLVGE